MQGLRQPTRAILHQSIHQPVKQQFQCSGHISPITRHTHYHNIAPLHQPQYPQRIIFGQYTCSFLPASHTPHAGSYLQMRHRHSFTLGTRPNSFYTHSIGHCRPPGTRTGINNQHFHTFCSSRHKKMRRPYCGRLIIAYLP